MNMRKSILTTIILSFFLTACASYKTTQEKFVAVNTNISKVETKLDNLESSVSNLEVANKETLAVAQGKFVYTKEMPEVTIQFNAGDSKLSKDAKEKLTDLVNRLQTQNRNVYIEIQGHTDSKPSSRTKYLLGANRAEIVRLFLNQAGVDLNRMSAISYADQLPVGSNETNEGRIANRRVVIKIVN